MTLAMLLEIAIAMAFLYLICSQVVLSIYELWAGYRNVRGKFLYEQLQGSLGVDTANALYANAPVALLSPPDQAAPNVVAATAPLSWWLGKDGLPAYIAPDLFAKTLLNLLAPTAGAAVAPATPIQAVAAALAAPPATLNPPAITLLADLLSNVDQTKPDALEIYQRNIAAWYDAYGERLTGWYKRRVRPRLFFIGVLVAALGNIDTPYIIQYLRTHDAERGQISTLITQKLPSSAQGSPITPPKVAANTDSLVTYVQATQQTIADAATQLRGYGFPIGRPSRDTIRARKVALAPIDSTTLPDFYEEIAARTEARLRDKDGKLKASKAAGASGDTWVLVTVPAHYRRYQRQALPLLDRDLAVTGYRWQISSLPQTPGALPKELAQSSNRTPTRLAAEQQKQLSELRKAAQADSARRSQAQQSHWFNPQYQVQQGWQTWLGWVITALLLAVGAPFWFDLLCRVVNIRNLGIKPPRMPQKS
ncbi:hypothetical protein [Hymenobacter chitinivorans]|uniref:Uncharacterized protein n=1 Tax=Hymenobacter chitinivorans DSM 11115 TaxID=1121954 RepID=A0A2M9AS66_9BACT|nr:hypothetical protein [Hymenobacter chitinivorans]PJJ48527.1 hypothetical protein CLV45_4236 [Hymenobacter chitinivorans DSM 11115]